MLANPMRGEAALGEYKLVVDFNRICTLEAVTKMKMPQPVIAFKMGDFGFSELRTYVRVFLDKPMSDEEAGNLIATLGQQEVPIPKELRRRGDPAAQLVWVASVALNEAFDGFMAPRTEKSENPPLAA